MSTRAIRRRTKKQVNKIRESSNTGSDGFEKPIEDVKPRFIQIKFRALMDKVREVQSTQIDAVIHTFIEPERIRKILSYSEDDFAEEYIYESEEKALYHVLDRIMNYEELIEYFTSGDSKIVWMGRHSDVLHVLTAKKPPYSWRAVLTLYSIPLEMIVETLSQAKNVDLLRDPSATYIIHATVDGKTYTLYIEAVVPSGIRMIDEEKKMFNAWAYIEFAFNREATPPEFYVRVT